ncbi:hypothetical protein [Paenibacillus sp. RC84]|uniref:hypothetical protein n=1 Tax=Paenibacillus sp. RC84 TaxID=3156252 RepID=UPI0035185E9A
MEPDDPAAQYFADTGYIGYCALCGLMDCHHTWNQHIGARGFLERSLFLCNELPSIQKMGIRICWDSKFYPIARAVVKFAACKTFMGEFFE